MVTPTTFPRRVTTGPLRHIGEGRVSLRGGSYNYRLTSGQASYAMFRALAKIK